ncbi:MAG: polysaccharide biosynthesis/export family protein [Brumimicrobium sp.]
MVYFQKGESDTTAQGVENYEMKFRKGDFLHIDVSGATPEAVAIFNPIPNVSFRANYNGSYQVDNPQVVGYIVDNDGNINFPVIGKVEVAGKTKLELEKNMVEMLEGHIDTPILNIRLRNFKVSVLGDVAKPGTFTVASERITLPEAIGIAGDLNITAMRENILVIRNNSGKKKEYRVDLTSNELFDSPVYYLQQNDVIYVEPNQAKMNTSKYSPVYSVLISVTSLVITTVVLITNN